MQWFRLYSEAIDDEKLRLLAFEDRWHFVALLCLKAQGVLEEKDPELRKRKISVKMGLDSVELETVMKRLVTVGLVSVTLEPINWKRRQFISDSSTSRVRAFRKRFSNALVTPSESESESESEQKQKREEGIKTLRAKRSASTAQRLPTDFDLIESRKAIARAEAVNPEREFARFCDHWRAASGANARKHDWDAAWRNWCRKASEFTGANGRTNKLYVPTKSADQLEAEAIARGENPWA